MNASQRFEAYLAHLAEGLGHADRHAGLRGYCTGLMLPLKRKRVEPIAASVDPLPVSARHQSLHHFVAKSGWSDEEMLRRVREWIRPKLGGGWLLDRRRQRVSETKPTLGGCGAAGLRGSWAKSRSRASDGTAAMRRKTAALERQGAGTGPFRNRRTRPCAGARERTRCCPAALPRCGSAHAGGNVGRARLAAAGAADRMAAQSGGAGAWPACRTAQLRSLHPTARSTAGPCPSAVSAPGRSAGAPHPRPSGRTAQSKPSAPTTASPPPAAPGTGPARRVGVGFLLPAYARLENPACITQASQ